MNCVHAVTVPPGIDHSRDSVVAARDASEKGDALTLHQSPRDMRHDSSKSLCDNAASLPRPFRTH
ncbi:MAG TPA: hypothetical protein VFD64_07335 [Gemmatimonadaceae bacterium]|nr:hypothetical protein [Gemmatimonadaceae bacterium]